MVSLRSKLGLGLVLSLVGMFTLAWFFIGLSVRELFENQMSARLQHDAENLLGGLSLAANGKLQLDHARIHGFYQQPFSGHYFVILDGEQTIRSRSLWDESLPVQRLPAGEIRIQRITGPQGQALLMWSRGFNKNGRPVTIAVAENMEVLEQGFAAFQKQYLFWSLIAVIILLLIQRYIVVFSLRSVNAAARDVARLEEAEINSLTESVPSEILPLVRAINSLLARQHKRLQRSREAMGNLAHAIKTPLTLLQQTVDDAFTEDRPEVFRQVREYNRQISRLVDKALRQARLAGDAIGVSRFSVNTDLPVLIDTLEKLHRDRSVTLELQVEGVDRLPLEKQDGMELLGNLLDNAWKWTRSRIRLTIEDRDGIHVTVEDDGPGADDITLQNLARRGQREDESVPGYGIGLSIVQGLVEDLDGQVHYGRSELGGLKVELRLK